MHKALADASDWRVKTLEGEPGCYRRALRRLAEGGVRACLLRDDPCAYAHLPELDLLVPRGDMDRATAVLVAGGWEPLPASLADPLKRQFLMFEAGVMRKLDVHGALVSGGLVYASEGWFWSHARSMESGDGFTPDAAAFAFHCIMHVVLGKQRLAAKHEEPLLRALAVARRDALFEAAASFRLAPVLAETLRDPVGVLADAAQVRRLRRIARRRLLADPGNAGRMLSFLCGRMLETLGRARPRLLIAVIGPDGAGKTSFISALQSRLEATFGFPAQAAYMGPWDRHVLPTSRLLARLEATPLDRYEHNPSRNWRWRILQTVDPRGRLRRMLYYANMPFESSARHLVRVKQAHARHRAVIADRYIYDLLVGYRNDVVENHPRLRDIIASLAPKPDVTILLHEDPDRIFERKPEYPAPVLRRALEAYRAIGERRPLTPIRTNRSAEDLARDFVEQNWRAIVRRQMGSARRQIWAFAAELSDAGREHR